MFANPRRATHHRISRACDRHRIGGKHHFHPRTIAHHLGSKRGMIAQIGRSIDRTKGNFGLGQPSLKHIRRHGAGDRADLRFQRRPVRYTVIVTDIFRPCGHGWRV